MVEIVAAIVDSSKNIYYLSNNNLSLKVNDKVVIETDLGLFDARIIKGNYMEKEDNLLLPLKKVDRIITDEDIKLIDKLNSEEEKVLDFAKKSSKSLELDMSFIDAKYNLDKSVLIISYVSESRVDFRELAKKIAQKFHSRIELRQVGVRDKAKRIGGIGPCGLFLCCNSFLTDFNSVSINMAKNQNLALSPNKINGSCGRLLCCLGYENEVYSELKKDLPKVGMVTDTPFGMGKVTEIDILRGTYKVDLKEKGIIEFNKDEKNEGIK